MTFWQFCSEHTSAVTICFIAVLLCIDNAITNICGLSLVKHKRKPIRKEVIAPDPNDWK